MSDAEEWEPSCYDCGHQPGYRNLVHREVMMHHDEGMGYDMVPVPLCRACVGRRYGFDCPQCGITHDSREDAVYCCRRRPGEAPDCLGCGRRMKRGAWGHSPETGPSVEWAECECCPIAWGRFTGWHRTDGGKCDHIDSVDQSRLSPVNGGGDA